MNSFRQLLWALAAIGSVIGGINFLTGLSTATSAPQQAAAAALAIGWAVIPYVFARAMDEIVRLSVKP